MASVNITTSKLFQVASSLKAYSDQMKTTAGNMDRAVRRMQSWTDNRARQFVDKATLVCQGLRSNMDSFSKMAAFLEKFARQQEEAERLMKQRVDNVRGDIRGGGRGNIRETSDDSHL